jgi:signal transduction histidine kinase
VDKDYVFSSVEGMNAYRIIQESVNNALKYANATKVSVSIVEQDGKLKFKIEDNGYGFDMDLVEMVNGLNNMKKRAQEVGGGVSH